MNKNHILHNLFYVKEICFVLILFLIYGYLNNKTIYKISIFLILFILFFFRNNLKLDTLSNNIFISPSSSRVIKIINKNNINIIISHISLLDRHFMIAPVDCKVIKIEDINIDKNDAERKRVTFEDVHGNIFSIDQIVNKIYSELAFFGYLPSFIKKKRCVTFCKVGDKLKQGERYGLIRFGSMTQYNLPKNYILDIKKNKHYKLGNKIAHLPI